MCRRRHRCSRRFATAIGGSPRRRGSFPRRLPRTVAILPAPVPAHELDRAAWDRVCRCQPHGRGVYARERVRPRRRRARHSSSADHRWQSGYASNGARVVAAEGRSARGGSSASARTRAEANPGERHCTGPHRHADGAAYSEPRRERHVECSARRVGTHRTKSWHWRSTFSDDVCDVTGAVFSVDGGRTAG